MITVTYRQKHVHLEKKNPVRHSVPNLQKQNPRPAVASMHELPNAGALTANPVVQRRL